MGGVGLEPSVSSHFGWGGGLRDKHKSNPLFTKPAAGTGSSGGLHVRFVFRTTSFRSMGHLGPAHVGCSTGLLRLLDDVLTKPFRSISTSEDADLIECRFRIDYVPSICPFLSTFSPKVHTFSTQNDRFVVQNFLLCHSAPSISSFVSLCRTRSVSRSLP